MNNKSRLLLSAQDVLKTIGTAYDVAQLFGFDYSNVKNGIVIMKLSHSPPRL